MKKLFSITLFSVLLLTSTQVLAKRKLDLFDPNKPTPQAILIDNMTKPKLFEKSNNLTKRAGSFNVATGEALYIKGTVTDAFGVPIEGAIIKIWQTNATGHYQNLLSKDSKYIDPNFLTSGEAVTDNLGRYGFLTIFPGFYKDRAPHINIIISHQDFGKIETEFYFENHPKNKKDPYYLSYKEDDREMLTADVEYVNPKNHKEGKVAIFNIIMQGMHQFKGF